MESGGGTTLILEKTANLLGKVKISGGGRCNVTHDCPDAREFSKNYPRGARSLIGPLHRWSSIDTIRWFESHGIALKTEADGRMFPVTDNSQTIIDCLTKAADSLGIEIRTRAGVEDIQVDEGEFILTLEQGEILRSRNILIATGGTRLAAGARLAEQLGHPLAPAVPSLFTFKIKDPLIEGIPGVSVANVAVRVEGTKLKSSGPLLITHWGVSGPGILRLSAWGARDLANCDYCFDLHINWLPGIDAQERIMELRQTWGKRQLHPRTIHETIPKRLWQRFLQSAEIADDQTWAQLTKTKATTLANLLNRTVLAVDGKSMNKEEFVTCGGVKLKDINLTTMESKICPGLFFAGEVIDIDGITGGFNFQNAWTSGHLAGAAIADRTP